MNLYNVSSESVGYTKLEPGMVVRIILHDSIAEFFYSDSFTKHHRRGGTFLVDAVDEDDYDLPVYVEWHDENGLRHGEWTADDVRYEIVGQP